MSPRDLSHTGHPDQSTHEVWHPREQAAEFKIRDFGKRLKETAMEWSDDQAQRMGASLAFYTLFSLSPLIVILVAVLAMVLGKQTAEGHLSEAANRIMGSEGSRLLQTMIRGAGNQGAGLIATVISGVTLLVSASTVAAELQDALNIIWHVPQKSRSILGSLMSMVKERFYALAIILGGGVLLLLSFSLTAWAGPLLGFFHEALAIPDIALRGVEFVVTLAVITLILAVIYKVLPGVNLTWADVFLGALFTAVLLTLGKEPLGWYLRKVSVGSSYGAAGSLAAILIWIYYSAQLFYFGAEFTKIYARKHGSQREHS